MAIIAFLTAFPFAARAEQTHLKVLMLPFDMHSKEDISSVRKAVMELLASELHRRGVEITGIPALKELMLKEGVKKFDDASAFRIAALAPSDYAVSGSVTRIGRHTNVDFRILDIADRSVVAFYFKSAGSDAELMQRLKEAVPSMQEKMSAGLKARPSVKSGIIDGIMIAGNRRVDTAAIMKKLASKAGEPFSPDNVKDDLRAVYATGFFEDVSADLTDSASGKVLTFIVKEMPFVKKIALSGNSALKEDRIREALTLKENTALDSVSLGENAAKIKGLYAEEGFYLARITLEISSDGVEATVTFKIDEGPEVRVKRVTFIGNRRFSKDSLLGLMKTSEVGWWSFVTQSGKFSEFIFQNDLASILSEYYDNGYVTADITDHRVLLSEDKKWFYITVALSEGEQYRIGNIDIKGDFLTTKADLFEKLKIKKGEIFSRAKLSRDIEAVSDVYGDKGYAYADIRPQTSLDPKEKTIDITIDIRKNELVYVERIDMTGNVRTRDKVLRRELELEEGKLFSSTDAKLSRNNLKRLGYFEDVSINQTRGSADDKMKVDINVKERPTGSISVGMGYSSVDKLIGTASISQSNFMGTGIRLDLTGTLSASSSRYSLGVTEPWLFDKPISAGFDVYNADKTYPDFNQRTTGFDVRLGFPITKRYTRGFITYRLEDVHISKVADTASSLIKKQLGASTMSSIKGAIRRDTRDDAFFPREGSVQIASAEFAGGPLGGTNYFIKYEGDAVKYLPVSWGDTAFSVHGGAGYVQSYGGKTSPVYERYYLGGINSVRGFKTRSLGPKDAITRDLVGGDTMIVFNGEFLFPISKQSLRGVVFYDAGNAFRGAIRLDQLRTAAGFGVRWYSPIGPLRLELGFNLDPKPGEAKQQFDFTIGTLF
ncbi:MAG: outer membrane protein assembly factor BamA [Deltaproteobacteria bacterium]|nr:outer membrane protein assembly factor BamA [Deltaproteobacteria bacterium]